MKCAAPNIWRCVDAVVTGLGYDFVGARYGREQGDTVLRVFIDSADGIGVDDCTGVSHQLSAELDIENLLNTAYVLEVSSPGLDRPLFREEDFVRFSGAEAKLQLSVPQNGRHCFTGRLIACQDRKIEIEVDGQCHCIPLSSVAQAHLVPAAGMYKTRR